MRRSGGFVSTARTAAEHIVTGNDVDTMDDAALAYQAENAAIFARVSPEQKNRVILALKARGHVVGYMGDGINDAPSLHIADVGISVMNGVDVAKDAAKIILLEKDLGVLNDGVVEGRRCFANIMKYIMGTSSNFGNMFSMAAASLFLPFLPMLPTQPALADQRAGRRVDRRGASVYAARDPAAIRSAPRRVTGRDCGSRSDVPPAGAGRQDVVLSPPRAALAAARSASFPVLPALLQVRRL
jgi:haloacid dehalogenase-like hydrolase